MTYQLRVSLRDSGPEVWRRLLVPGEATLANLHWVLQTALGWTNSQLHVFHIGDKAYSDPEMEIKRTKDERKVLLKKVAPKVGQAFVYEYDLRDRWLHTVEVESIVDKDERYPGHPLCLAGANACPPENCGGVRGYYELQKALANPKHPGHKEAVISLGATFDPRTFLPDAVNRALRVGWAGQVGHR
ncbi:MAG: plasmid pRiA4b ORF-3 family protein [candidate division WOR-3 bacterium]